MPRPIYTKQPPKTAVSAHNAWVSTEVLYPNFDLISITFVPGTKMFRPQWKAQIKSRVDNQVKTITVTNVQINDTLRRMRKSQSKRKVPS